jgi:threonine aldolase
MAATKSPTRIDLRAEVITKPTAEMWHAMQSAEMGWATRGEDENVLELQRYGAEATGKEACLFVFTASIANLLAMMIATERGDQMILDADAHQVWIEGWNLSYICGLYPRLVQSERGELPLDEVEELITGWRSLYRPKTSLIAIENPHNDHGGTILSPEYTQALADLARRHDCAVHLDGARIHNASVATGIPLKEYTEPLDTITISLNKGLGAPIGALLCGSAEAIDFAERKGLKWLGASGMHRVGILAAAALYSLNNMVDRLEEDHARARAIADGIRDLPGIEVNDPETNLVKITTTQSGRPADDFVRALEEQGVLATLREPEVFKLMTHLELDDQGVEVVIDSIRTVVGELAAGEVALPAGE